MPACLIVLWNKFALTQVLTMLYTTPMSDVENMMLEMLKKIQAEQSLSRERDQEILSRLSNIESGIARLARDDATNYGEIVQDRHAVDKLKERIERIERRLELSSQ